MASPLRKVGLELEFPVVLPDGRSLHRKHIKAVWREFLDRHTDWEPIVEYYRHALTGMHRTRADGREDTINTDNSVGLLEFSPAPERNIQSAVREWKKMARGILEILNEQGYSMLGLGMHPVTFNDRNRRTEKDWYLVLKDYLPGHYQLGSFAANQCAVDVSVNEALRAVNALHALSGIAIALCANSPVADGRLQREKEFRQTRWDACARREGMPAGYFFNQMPERSFQNYNDFLRCMWSLKSGIFASYKKGGDYIPGFPPFERYITSGRTWKAKNVIGEPTALTPSYEHVNIQSNYGWHPAKLHYSFTAGSLPELLDAYRAREMDAYFAAHAKRMYIEFRACAAQPQGEEAVVLALTLGLIENLSSAEALVARYGWRDWRALRTIAVRDALAGTWKGKRIADIAGDAVAIARAGLIKRGFKEEKYLEPLDARVTNRRAPADEVIAWWKEGGLQRILNKTRYRKEVLGGK